MTITASKLRANIYKTLDRILETGIPIAINRRGRILKIVPLSAKSKLDNLHIRKRDVFNGNPESIVHIDWSGEWKS